MSSKSLSTRERQRQLNGLPLEDLRGHPAAEGQEVPEADG